MDLLLSLKLTLRQARRSPAFFAIAVAALALGIGANTAIFSAVEGVLLRPLPYAQPDRLVIVWEDAAFIGFAHNTPSAANYVDWRKQNQVFTDMAALRYRNAALTGDQAPEQVIGRGVTPNFFDVLGVQPTVGRQFTAEEDAAKRKVVVLSYALWQRRYGGDASLIGRSILMDGEPVTVAGIMPRDFFFPDRKTMYWEPASFTAADLNPDRHFLHVVARLKPGVTLERLIACSNLANLLLARATGRRREIAVRVALGATRGQIATQLVTESLLLSMVGGAAGLLVGRLCWGLFKDLVPLQISAGAFSLNWHVLAFTCAISILAGAFFGLVPALRSTDVSLHDSLKEGTRSGESRIGMRLRDALVVGQFAMAFALLVGAGLMIETLWNLRKMDLGFRPDHLLTMVIRLPDKKYNSDEKLRGFYRDVLDRTREMPGVKSVGFGSDAPFTSIGDTNGYVIEGAPPPRPGEINDGLYREVTAGYLETIGANLLEGRSLEDGDRPETMPVVVVNEFLAKQHWPGQSAVGKHLRFTQEKDGWRTVVGVVKDIRERGLLLNMKPAIYVPVTQVKRPGADYLVVRTSQDPLAMVNALRSAVWSVDNERAMALIKSMDQLMEQDVADRTRPMTLLGLFAGLALVLACIGVYGVLAYAVAQRTREIGVRMALGASPGNVTRMILGRGLRLSGVGLAAGVAMAAGLSLLLRTLLYGVSPAAPLVYAGTASALIVVALAACVIPAQRAARVDPAVALRDE